MSSGQGIYQGPSQMEIYTAHCDPLGPSFNRRRGVRDSGLACGGEDERTRGRKGI